MGGEETPGIKPLRAVTAVLLELPRIGEASSALLTRVQLLPGVNLHVGLQLIGLVELSVAVHTFKGLLPRVDPQVSVEVPIGPEGLVTLITLVRFLTSVDPLVLL